MLLPGWKRMPVALSLDGEFVEQREEVEEFARLEQDFWTVGSPSHGDGEADLPGAGSGGDDIGVNQQKFRGGEPVDLGVGGERDSGVCAGVGMS